MAQPVRPISPCYSHGKKRAWVPAAAATPSKETTDLVKSTFDVHVSTPTRARGPEPINRLPVFLDEADNMLAKGELGDQTLGH